MPRLGQQVLWILLAYELLRRTEAMLSLCAIEPHFWVLLLSCFCLLSKPGCLHNDLLLCLSHQRLQAVRCRLGVATLCAHTGD